MRERMKRILITGPESTGKSELVLALAAHYDGLAVPEYAREYVKKLGRPYQYHDVEKIAQRQLREYMQVPDSADWVFFDTWLLITRVWFDLVFNAVPSWIDEKLKEARFDMVLLCDTDIPWIPDGIRENGGDSRDMLMQRYQAELIKLGMQWVLVSGTGQQRFNVARQHLDKLTEHGTT